MTWSDTYNIDSGCNDYPHINTIVGKTWTSTTVISLDVFQEQSKSLTTGKIK